MKFEEHTYEKHERIHLVCSYYKIMHTKNIF